MDERVMAAIEGAVRALYPDAQQIALIAERCFSEGDSGEVRDVNVSWKSEGELHVGEFVAKPTRGDTERRVLAALASTDIPVPRLIEPPEGSHEILVMERLPGTPLAERLRAANMRWELSALAFTFARMLARIHSLDWKAVTPWMADPDDLPEDLIDRSVEEMWESWQGRIEALPRDARGPFQHALNWLDQRRPVEVSVCLCHGDYSLSNVLIEADEVTGVLDWEDAQVTDASYDLALLAVELARLGLDEADAQLFAQAVLGAYLQSSPRTLGNLAFFTGARLLTETLDAIDANGAVARGEDVSEATRRRADTADERLAELMRTTSGDGRVPWQR